VKWKGWEEEGESRRERGQNEERAEGGERAEVGKSKRKRGLERERAEGKGERAEGRGHSDSGYSKTTCTYVVMSTKDFSGYQMCKIKGSTGKHVYMRRNKHLQTCTLQ